MSSAGMMIEAGCCCHGRPATSQPSVAVLAGNTTWTRMPLLVSSCCSERLKARTYALDAAYLLVLPTIEMPAAVPLVMVFLFSRLKTTRLAANHTRVSYATFRA